jgi:uracil-DNA glycosylase family 4
MSKKQEQLNQLRKHIEEDLSLPLRDEATQLVFGEGSPNAAIYILGEAPGEIEDRLGRPFVGRAGKLLENQLESIGLQRGDVYISNMVRFRPPENRPPKPAEIAAFEPYVSQEIAIIQPELIVTLGRFAMEKFLPAEKITNVHGTPQTTTWHGQTITVYPLFHPSAALRSPQVRKAFEEDIKKMPALLNTLSRSREEPTRKGQ